MVRAERVMRKCLRSILLILITGWITNAQEITPDPLLEKLDVGTEAASEESSETANEGAERFLNEGNRSFSSHDLRTRRPSTATRRHQNCYEAHQT